MESSHRPVKRRRRARTTGHNTTSASPHRIQLYRYSRLPTARHLRRCIIQPSADSDADIVVRLDVVPFDVDDRNSTVPEYEALSYTWGSEQNQQAILVETTDSSRYSLSVTPNLHCALLHLRRSSEPRTMWIDAICINQSDSVEKGPQVNMMGRIFQNARRAVVWLGPAADDSHVALSRLETIGSTLVYDEARHYLRLASDVDFIIVEKPWILSKVEIRSIASIVRRPWFRRLWIRQEITLASPESIVSCGRDEIHWLTLRSAMLLLDINGTFGTWPKDQCLERDLNESLELINGIIDQPRITSIVSVRSRFGRAECRDARDRLYAVLSLISEDVGIIPNYQKSYQQVYAEAAMNSFRETKRLDLLDSCELIGGVRSDMPSWVPDWSVAMKGLYSLDAWASSHILSDFIPYDEPAGGDGVLSPRVLRVSGVITAALSKVGPKLDIAPSKVSENQIQILHNVVAPEKPRTTADNPSLFEGYGRTLLAGNSDESYFPPVSSYPTVTSAASVLSKLSEGVPADCKFERDERNAVDCMYNRLIGRCLAWDSHMNPVLCPEQAAPGDLVCVIVGCWNAILLRPLASAPENGKDARYLVVGPCYSMHTHDGSALLGHLPRGIRIAFLEDKRRWGFVHDDTGTASLFDPRLEGEGERLGVDMDEVKFKLQGGEDLHLGFDQLKDLVMAKTGNELRWFDLV